MANAYITGRLSPTQIDIAYLLVAATGNGLEPGTWKSFCERIIEWRGATGLHDDVIVTADCQGHIKGLCVTQINQSLLFGRLLDVPLFICVSAADEEGVTLELVDAVKQHARLANCTDVRIWTQGGSAWARAIDNPGRATHYAGVHLRMD